MGSLHNGTHCKDDSGKPRSDICYSTAIWLLIEDENIKSLFNSGVAIRNGLIDDDYNLVFSGVSLLKLTLIDLGLSIFTAPQEMCLHGAEKYGMGNYEADGVDISRFCAAMFRHLVGTDDNPGIVMLGDINSLDCESGNPHIGAVVANALIILSLMYERHKKGKHEQIVNTMPKFKIGYFTKDKV